MGVHMPTLRDADRGVETGVGPVTAAGSGAALPVRWPQCNRKATSDLWNGRRAHRKGDFVSLHS